jgi:hypothetical protein
VHITVDLSTVPPLVELEGADDLKSFSVVLHEPEHAWVSLEELKRLAGPRAEDTEWLAELDKMVAYASSKGWVREDGALRAHLAHGT